MHQCLFVTDSCCCCGLQLELLGQSIYDFIHPCDEEELRDLLTPRPGQTFIITIQILKNRFSSQRTITESSDPHYVKPSSI